MAEPGPEPEPGRAWRVFALCGAAVFLAAVAAGAALLAWNLASSASRRPRCPEPAANTTAPPGDPGPEVEELRRRLAEAARLEEALTKRLKQAERVRRELEEALRACEGRQVGGQAGGLGNPDNEGRGAHTHPAFPLGALVSPVLQLREENENSTIPSSSYRANSPSCLPSDQEGSTNTAHSLCCTPETNPTL